MDKKSAEERPNEGRPVIMIALQENGEVKVTGYIRNESMANILIDKARIDLAEQFRVARLRNVNRSGGLIQHARNGFKR